MTEKERKKLVKDIKAKLRASNKHLKAIEKREKEFIRMNRNQLITDRKGRATIARDFAISKQNCEMCIDHHIIWAGDGYFCSKCMLEFIPKDNYNKELTIWLKKNGYKSLAEVTAIIHEK